MARILLVEDYEDLAHSLSKRLMLEQHSVEVANAGNRAEQLIQTRPFDLIILDWDLPEKAGIDICREYRNQGGATPIIMLTGKTEINRKTEGFEAGADDYLTKPFHPLELCARVKALLKRNSGNHPVIPAVTNAQMITGGQQSIVGADLDEKLEIISLVGEGSMGFVYKARHKMLNKVVAVKVLQPQLIANPQSLGRFQQEAKTIAALDHANVIKLHDFSVTPGGLLYIVTEFIEGQSLAQAIRAQGAISTARAVSIFRQAAEGLAHAHSKNIIHRDVKPSNLMLIPAPDGREAVKVVDFGIAKCADAPQGIQLTHTGEIFGSPLYMSPEQCKGVTLDHRSDIFSFGCVMYETLTGQAPFQDESVLMTMYKRTTETPQSLCEMRPDMQIPYQLEQIVFKALERDLDKRYQSMAQLRADLL